MDDNIRRFEGIYGIDFSGAKLAGRNTWLARIEPIRPRQQSPAYRLTDLANLGEMADTDHRQPVLEHLVGLIAENPEESLWAMDFPFGMPVEVLEPISRWEQQLHFFDDWATDPYGSGVECLRRAKRLGGPNHIRRLTDIEEKAPFDPYHYRIIYQTYFGVRHLLGPLRNRRRLAILPFHYRRFDTAKRHLVEACPASTLKALKLPHQNYKQPAGGRLTAKRVRTRKAILDGIGGFVKIREPDRRVIMRNGGGDALDAVIAAVGGVLGWQRADHRAIARHPRYPREGRLYV